MGLRFLHTSIFLKTLSLEGLPIKVKEDLSPHEMRLSPAGHQPSISSSGGVIIIIIIIIIILHQLILHMIWIWNAHLSCHLSHEFTIIEPCWQSFKELFRNQKITSMWPYVIFALYDSSNKLITELLWELVLGNTKAHDIREFSASAGKQLSYLTALNMWLNKEFLLLQEIRQ